MTDDDVTRNRAAQERLYGRPLGELLRRYAEALGVTQGRLAELLGVSAPMLSQLANGRRVRFGNPASVQRLQVVHAAALDVESGRSDRAAAVARVEQNRASDVFTSTTQPDEPVEDAVRRLFAAAGTAEQHLDAAALLESAHPRIAQLVRVGGAGSVQDLRALLGAPAAEDG